MRKHQFKLIQNLKSKIELAVKNKIFCVKMKKAEIFWQTETQNGLSKLRIIFLSELAKVFLRKKIIFPNSLPFSFCFDIAIHGAHLRAAESQLKTFSVIQLSNIVKTKRSGNFQASFENFRVTAPKTISSFLKINSLNFYVSGAENLSLPLF